MEMQITSKEIGPSILLQEYIQIAKQILNLKNPEN